MKKLYLICCFNAEGQPIKSMMVRCDQLALKMRMEEIACFEAWHSTVEAYEINPNGPPLRIGEPVHTIETIG
jgi:hypothetical protein